MLVPLRSPRFVLAVSLLAWALTALTGCGGTVISGLGTSVATLPTEDLQGPCTYELQLATGANAAAITQAGVLVIFERGDR